MTPEVGGGPSSRQRSILKFAGGAAAIATALAAIGYAPTVRVAGPAAAPAMFAGVGVSLAASLLGAVPVLLAPVQKRAQAALGATLVRFLVAAALAVVVVLGFEMPARPFLVWLGVSYAALLPLDAAFAARWSQAVGREER